MPTETLWFPHDLDSTDDPKMQALIGKYEAWGYGIFWRISEMLHSTKHSNNHRLPFKKYIFLAIAKQLTSNAQQMEANAKQIENLVTDCIELFELLVTDGEFFWSKRVDRNMEKRQNISIVRQKAGQKGGKSKKLQAIAKQTEANPKQNVAEREIDIERDISILDSSARASEKILEREKTETGREDQISPGAEIPAPELNEVMVYLTPERKIAVSFYDDGKANAKNLAFWLASPGGPTLTIMQNGLLQHPDPFIQFILCDFSHAVIDGAETSPARMSGWFKNYWASKSESLMRQFNKKQTTVAKIDSELAAITDVDEVIKKSFRDYYTRVQPAGNYYFEQRKNFVVADELKVWAASEQKNSTNGSQHRASRKDHANRPVITGTATTAGTL